MAIESFDKKKMGICADLVLIAIESFALVVSLWLSVTLREGEWFQRSGAIVVLISVILEIRQSKAKQPERLLNTSANSGLVILYSMQKKL